MFFVSQGNLRDLGESGRVWRFYRSVPPNLRPKDICCDYAQTIPERTRGHPILIMWTNEQPSDTAEGYYWWRASDHDKFPEVVFVNSGKVSTLGNDEEFALRDHRGQWSGAIIEPL